MQALATIGRGQEVITGEVVSHIELFIAAVYDAELGAMPTLA